MVVEIANVKQITDQEALNLKKGSIILVRSMYNYERYNDHPALIVGGTIKKERGLRPNLLTFPRKSVDNLSELLNQFDRINDKILLLLDAEKTAEFMQEQGIHLSDGELLEIEDMKVLSNFIKNSTYATIN